MTDCQGRLWLEISVYAQHKGSLDGFGDSWISFLGNQVFAWTSMWGCKVGNIFAKIYSFMTNGSDPLKIWVSFHLLTFAHLGWCLWCEGEGLSHCECGGSASNDFKSCIGGLIEEMVWFIKLEWMNEGSNSHVGQLVVKMSVIFFLWEKF